MKAETEALLYQCRTALLHRSAEELDVLLKGWFECMIGEEHIEEELDDLCVLLNYRVRSAGSDVAYGTYTAWWEVEGYREPSEGEFVCAHVSSLHQYVLDCSLREFYVLVEVAYQALAMTVEFEGGGPLATGQAFLVRFAEWLSDVTRKFKDVPQKPYFRGGTLSKEQRRQREQEMIAQASQQGYLVIYPGTTSAVKNAFRHWCKVSIRPYICVEVMSPQLVRVSVDLKTLDSHWEALAEAQIQDSLLELTQSYIARSHAQRYQAQLHWIARHLVVLEEVLAEDGELVAQDLVALSSELLKQKKQQVVEERKMIAVANQPDWMRAIAQLRSQESEIAPLAERVVLPAHWADLLTRPQLCAFLTFLELPAVTRDHKAELVERLLKRLDTDAVARAQFFEVFVLELGIPPWELEELLACTTTERKRWVEEERLAVLGYRNFRKGGSEHEYPIFDRRIILSIAPEEVEGWRAEHQAQVHERRKAGAQVAAANRKAKSAY